MMLAEAADAAAEGPLAGFKLIDRDRYELRIAVLLHDCGKVTTPAHVVGKATKLQMLFDWIHLIDTRCEVVRRDAEIRKWRSIAEGAPADEAERRYLDFCRPLNDDRNALRQANIGCKKNGRRRYRTGPADCRTLSLAQSGWRTSATPLRRGS